VLNSSAPIAFRNSAKGVGSAIKNFKRALKEGNAADDNKS